MMKCKGKNPVFLGSRRSAAALFLGAAARGCYQSGGFLTSLGAAALAGSAAALGYF